ncbi:MAG: c-type cytochrome biogenesis protein CcmI [Hyphomicrobiales bacterium]|nr:c-type cytochrome biogenesis protein CcmI [Hyphomicrobiales bacterium]
MVLWLVLAALTAAVVVAVAAPALASGKTRRSVSSVDFYKSQLKALDADVARGVVSAADADALRAEMSRRLLAAADSEPSAPNARGASPSVAAVVAAAITTVSLGFYLYGGSPGAPGMPLAARLEDPAQSATLEGMVAKVEARLRTHPGDAMGWSVIAPVYLRQQRFADAAEAFRRAMVLSGETPERLAGFGEAAMMAADGVASSAAYDALSRAVKARPDLLRARFFLALADEARGDKGAARANYEAVLKASDDPQWRKAIEDKLVALDAPQAAPDERQRMIEGMVSGLAERLDKSGGEVAEWLQLARAYSVLGQRDAAAAAVAKARSQFAGNLDALRQIDEFARALGLSS